MAEPATQMPVKSIGKETEPRRLPVLDEVRRMVGMINLGDISHALPRDITGGGGTKEAAHHA